MMLNGKAFRNFLLKSKEDIEDSMIIIRIGAFEKRIKMTTLNKIKIILEIISIFSTMFITAVAFLLNSFYKFCCQNYYFVPGEYFNISLFRPVFMSVVALTLYLFVFYLEISYDDLFLIIIMNIMEALLNFTIFTLFLINNNLLNILGFPIVLIISILVHVVIYFLYLRDCCYDGNKKDKDKSRIVKFIKFLFSTLLVFFVIINVWAVEFPEHKKYYQITQNSGNCYAIISEYKDKFLVMKIRSCNDKYYLDNSNYKFINIDTCNLNYRPLKIDNCIMDNINQLKFNENIHYSTQSNCIK